MLKESVVAIEKSEQFEKSREDEAEQEKEKVSLVN